MAAEVRRCPVHAEADADVLHAWACPDDCEHFHAELQRRVDHVKAGNYFRLVSMPGDRPLMFQEYRDGQPYGWPHPMAGEGEFSDE